MDSKARCYLRDDFDITDIGGNDFIASCRQVLQELFLNPPVGQQPFLDDLVFSSDEGLAQWPGITRLRDYYQTRDEIALLQESGHLIAAHVGPDWSIIDLGSGDTRKVQPLLNHLEAQGCPVDYYCVDLSRPSLVSGLAQLATSGRYRHVKLHGLWGTFDDAREWCRTQITSSKLLLSLGSMMGNDRWDVSVADLIEWAGILSPTDRFLLGIDSNQDRVKIWESYHDEGRVFETFLRTGLAFTNRVLGHVWFRDSDWQLAGEMEDSPLLIHRFVFKCVAPVSCPQLGIEFDVGDRVECYEGHKYTVEEMKLQFKASGLKDLENWKSSQSDIYDYVLSKVEND